MTSPEYGTEEYRQWAALFNDITRTPDLSRHVLFSDRHRITEYLWEQGWRRDVRPEDVTLASFTSHDLDELEPLRRRRDDR